MLLNFKENFYGGTRSNRFRVDGQFPTGGGFTDFHVRATTIPNAATKVLSYDYFGRKFNYPGEKEYGTWSFQAWDDTGTNNLWGQLQKWQNYINDHDTNISAINANGTGAPGSVGGYKAYNWKIQHLDLNGNTKPLKEYILHGCWPAGIQQVTLNMGSPSTFNSFNVIIVFDYIEIKDVTSLVNLSPE
jgi:hypothetical protein